MSALIVIATWPKNSRETLRVALDRYKDMDLVDVRVCVALDATTGALTPTAKGISLSVSKLPALVAALSAAEARARALGLIGEASA